MWLCSCIRESEWQSQSPHQEDTAEQCGGRPQDPRISITSRGPRFSHHPPLPRLHPSLSAFHTQQNRRHQKYSWLRESGVNPRNTAGPLPSVHTTVRKGPEQGGLPPTASLSLHLTGCDVLQLVKNFYLYFHEGYFSTNFFAFNSFGLEEK